MPDLPSFPDLFRIGRTEALVRNRRLSAEELDRQGSDLNILIAAPAAMADECMGQLAAVRAELFSGTARGDALDRLITDRYPDLVRKQAAPSYGYLTFSFSAPVSAAFTIPDGTVASTADGIQFITVGSAAVAIGATSKTLPIRSVLAGANQKATAGKIRNLISTITGAPATGMTVNNTAATVGGENKERDADYVTRYQRYYLAARRATTGAIEQAVLSVPGVVKATVYENLDTLGRPIGYVQVVVSDSFTEQFLSTSVLPATYANQLSNLSTAIQSTLREWRAAGVGVTVTFASVIVQTVRLVLSYVAGADEAAVNNIVLAGVVQKINNLAPGASLRLEDLRNILRTTSGVYYTGSEILSPTGDVVVQAQQVLRTSSTFVTIGV